jgi:hypothetical protein
MTEIEIKEALEPNWQPVKWTEVERLENAGCRVQYSSLLKSTQAWHDRDSPYKGGIGCPESEYRVDMNTVPDGMELYEPEWVDVHWRNVTDLLSAPVDVQFESANGDWISLDSKPIIGSERTWFQGGVDGNKYRADRKTFPVGFEMKPVRVTLMEKFNEVMKGQPDVVTSPVIANKLALFTLITIIDSELEELSTGNKEPRDASRPIGKDRGIE